MIRKRERQERPVQNNCQKTLLIRSQWEMPFDDMSDIQKNILLKHKYARCIIDKISKDFIIRNPEFTFYEIRCAAAYGFWKAMETYDPDRGKFSNHASFVCRSYINFYIYSNTSQQQRKLENPIEENLIVKNDVNKLDRRISIKQIFSKISTKSQKVLQTVYIENSTIKESMESLGVSRFRINKMINSALEEAKEYI